MLLRFGGQFWRFLGFIRVLEGTLRFLEHIDKSAIVPDVSGVFLVAFLVLGLSR